MRRRTAFYVGATAILLLASVKSQAQSPTRTAAPADRDSPKDDRVADCTAPNPHAARLVLRALSEKRFAEFRERFNLSDLRPTDLHLLVNTRNTAECRQLSRYYADSPFLHRPFIHTYYKAKDYYFASFVDPKSLAVHRGNPPHFAVFDKHMKLVAVFPQ